MARIIGGAIIATPTGIALATITCNGVLGLLVAIAAWTWLVIR